MDNSAVEWFAKRISHGGLVSKKQYNELLEQAKMMETKQRKQHKEVLEVLETIEVILESGNSINPNSTILRNAIKLALQKSAHPLNAISHE